MAKKSDDEKFIERIPEGGCWVWTGTLRRGDYGSIFRNGVSLQAARYYYELYRGKIPEGLFLNHLCGNNCCCNPWHMEAVIWTEISERGKVNQHKGKEYCEKGHLFDEHNTYIVPKTGHRQCKECNRIRKRKYKQMKYGRFIM